MFKFLKYLINTLKPIQPLYVAFDLGDRRKPTIVLLHGIAATSKTWVPLIKELKTDTHRIIAIDLLGFGKSIKPTYCNYTVDDHTMYIRKTIKKLRIKGKYKIVGHSMGSIIAAHYCILFPGDISKAYLLSLPLYLDDPELNIIAQKRKDLYMKAYEFILQNKDSTINNLQFLRKLLRIEDGIDVNEENWNSFKLSLQNTIIIQDAYNDIKNSTIPTQIIYGAFDEFLVPESIDKLAKFNHVTVTKLPAVNHLLGSRFASVVAKRILEADV